jgi:hypothetical protein
MALGGLGAVSSSLGDLRQSRQHFRAALEAAAQARNISVPVDILASIAQLLARMGQHERAVELAGFALHHHASTRQTRDKAERLLADLRSQIAPGAIAAAQARLKEKPLEAVVDEVLGEMWEK